MTDLLTLAELVDELTNPIQVREPYHIWHGNNRKIEHHIHTQPSLIRQLERAKFPGETYRETQGKIRRTPAKLAEMAPANVDAINLSYMIQIGAANWAWRCRLTVSEDTTTNLRRLVGAQTDSDTRSLIESQLRRWLYTAKVIAGWQNPPWRPDAPCPACDQRQLRVRLDMSLATCAACHETWDRDTIGILAAHVASTTQRSVLA